MYNFCYNHNYEYNNYDGSVLSLTVKKDSFIYQQYYDPDKKKGTIEKNVVQNISFFHRY